jgi:hypothetical protein
LSLNDLYSVRGQLNSLTTNNLGQMQ